MTDTPTQEFLFWQYGGLASIKVRPATLNLEDFKAAMTSVGVMTPTRYKELISGRIGFEGAEADPEKTTPLVQLVSSEVMASSHAGYIKAVNKMKEPMIQVDEFGKRKTGVQSQRMYGIHRIGDDYVTPGYEHLIPQNVVDDFNKRLKSENRHPFISFKSPIPDLQPADQNKFIGSPFTIHPYIMTDFTPSPEMAALGFPDWHTRSENQVIFCVRMGEIFVLTTGRGAQVVEPYWDKQFPAKVAEWVRAQPIAKLQKSPLFVNRHQAVDAVISLSIMAGGLQGLPYEANEPATPRKRR